MWDWLLASIDPSRGHEVGALVSWHARTMTLAWGVIAPTAILAARFFKILPGQDWPNELDNKLWWHSHLFGQIFAYVLSLVGFGLILLHGGAADALVHRALGYAVLALGTLQVALGYLRGSKGGPTAPAPDGSLRGDHFDMTPWRLMFERLHKSMGYVALALAAIAILSGLWQANAPRWMWMSILSYWTFLSILAVYLQKKGRAFDTYQAIWGADPALPGNKIPKMGWGTVRPGDRSKKGSKENCEGGL